MFYGNLTLLDLKGNPVKRSKVEYPYSYDEFVIWKSEYDSTKSLNVYSDRLYSWDSAKFEEACLAIWGDTKQVFYVRTPKEIEQFLIKYLGKEIKLTAFTECCNVANGYPIWVFYYEEL